MDIKEALFKLDDFCNANKIEYTYRLYNEKSRHHGIFLFKDMNCRMRRLFFGAYKHFQRIDVFAVFLHFEVQVCSVHAFAALAC